MMPHVLLAEDEPLVALSLADFLEAVGYQVTMAHDGTEALKRAAVMTAAGQPPRALVTDLNMPCMRGEDLIRALRTERPGMPVVVITGSPPEGGATALQQYGGGYGQLALLHKPIDYAALSKALQHTLHGPETVDHVLSPWP